ncbi:hypothetical protein GH733_005471 [Mirounga leonina]|nr:hypothetical protein GH733_005471 [Mirounga leonina]
MAEAAAPRPAAVPSGMEEADRILIHSLRQAGTAVPPDVQILRAFTTELVVEAVVHCLRNFLYPSEPDLRDLLLFLAERLPFDASKDGDQLAGDSAILLQAIRSQIWDQLALPPLLCTPKLQHLQDSASQKPFHITRLVMPELSSRREPREFQASPLLLPAPTQVPQPARRVAPLFECHTIQLCQHTGRNCPGDEDWVHWAPCHPTQEDTWA